MTADAVEPRLPEATLQRLKVLAQQRDAVNSQISVLVQTSLDFLALTGSYNVDMETGVLTPAPQPTPLKGNRKVG